MAFQAPVNVQNIVSATSELWPTMSAVLRSPWQGLGRHATTVATPTQQPSAALMNNCSAAELHGNTPEVTNGTSPSRRQISGRNTLPEALQSVPMSALRNIPSQAGSRSIPSIAGTIASVPHGALRLLNPMAFNMPKATAARNYSTLSRFGPFKNLRPVPRPGQLGLAMAQQRTIFGPPSHATLARLEQSANNNPSSALAQAPFYSALLKANMPNIVVERYNSGQFATNSLVDSYYNKALKQLGQVGAQVGDGVAGSNLSPQQLQAVGQAVGARAGGGTLGKLRAGGGAKSDPLYVVIEESWWSHASKWAKFLIGFGLAGYVALVLVTLFVESSGVLKKVGGGGNAEVRPEHQNTRFSDVHGCDEAKEELTDVVDFLKNPDKYNKLGGRLPKGVLLVGPPGTGKTLLARAVAGEAGVPFFYMSGSEFDEVYVGVGAKRIRELFNAARSKAPAIVFIDELDAVGGKRNSRDANYHRQTLNQLLNDLDGFDQSTGVIFIAATNHAEILDKALTRPGRFDRHIQVELPDARGRLAILKHHMKKIRLAPEVDLMSIARGTPGFSGAELENLANSAAIQASKHQSKFVTVTDLEWAKDKIMMGSERKSRVVQLEDKLHTAYHEAGHALVGIYMKGYNDVHKATILPRGHAAGITFFLPRDGGHRTRLEYMVDLQVSMGGKVAEEMIYGRERVSDGPSGDIQQATNLAYMMVTRLGFSDLLGNVDLYNNYQRLSPETKRLIDTEAKRFIEEAKDEAKRTLAEHRKELDLLAQALVQYETLDRDEIMKVIKGEKLKDRLMSMPDAAIKLPNVLDVVPPVPGGGGDSDPPPPTPPVPGLQT